MNRRWLCNDVWMDILPSFDSPQLGLKMALLSPRFNALVDAHFDGKSELTIWSIVRIEKDEGPKPKMTILMDGKNNFVDFPLSDRQLPNICFKNLQILYIDHSVITFLRSKKRFFDRRGTNLQLFVQAIDMDVQQVWDVFIREIWQIFATNIRQLYFRNANHLDNLRRRTSPTFLTDLDHLTSIDSGALFPDGIADDGPNATAGQALSKWLHTPSKNGQPKRLYRNGYSGPLGFEWVDNFKEAFRRATTSVSYKIQLYFRVDTMPIEQFELVNGWTKEKLTLKQKSEKLGYICMYNWLLQRCPIGETATAPVKWKNRENSGANFNHIRFDQRYDNNSGANLNNIRFDLWGGNRCIGPLSSPAEEELDQSNEK